MVRPKNRRSARPLDDALPAKTENVSDFEEANRPVRLRKVRNQTVSKRSAQVPLILRKRVEHFDGHRVEGRPVLRGCVERLAPVQRMGDDFAITRAPRAHVRSRSRGRRRRSGSRATAPTARSLQSCRSLPCARLLRPNRPAIDTSARQDGGVTRAAVAGGVTVQPSAVRCEAMRSAATSSPSSRSTSCGRNRIDADGASGGRRSARRIGGRTERFRQLRRPRRTGIGSRPVRAISRDAPRLRCADPALCSSAGYARR